ITLSWWIGYTPMGCSLPSLGLKATSMVPAAGSEYECRSSTDVARDSTRLGFLLASAAPAKERRAGSGRRTAISADRLVLGGHGTGAPTWMRVSSTGSTSAGW